MRRAVHLLTFGLLFVTVRSCGVNETYDRMKYGADSLTESVGVPAAGRALTQDIYPAITSAASQTVHKGSAATLQSAERVTGSDRESLRERIRKTAARLKQAVLDFIGGPPAAAPERERSPEETQQPRDGSSTLQSARVQEPTS